MVDSIDAGVVRTTREYSRGEVEQELAFYGVELERPPSPEIILPLAAAAPRIPEPEPEPELAGPLLNGMYVSPGQPSVRFTDDPQVIYLGGERVAGLVE